MSGSSSSSGRSSVLATDAAREQVVEELRIAASNGQLGVAELEERIERTYRARTNGELEAEVDDLDTALDASPLILQPGMGKLKQTGRWTVPRHIDASCRIFSIEIDFTEATCPHREVTVSASCGAGNIVMIVPRGWAVEVDGSSVNTGHISNRATGPPKPAAPRLRVIGRAGSGRIRIRHPRRRIAPQR